MQKSLSLSEEDFDPKIYLSTFCKRQHLFTDAVQPHSVSQIDFLSLQKQLNQMQIAQQKTCEQIVEFVDQHRDNFIQINDQLDAIEGKIKQSEFIIKLLNKKIDDYKTSYYLQEARIQKYINAYELHLLEQQIIQLVKNQALFVAKFNQYFQKITNKDISELNLIQKTAITRFTYKLKYFQMLFDHQIIKNIVPQNLQITEIVMNLADELQFYLSEQLSKYQTAQAKSKDDINQNNKIKDSLKSIKMWYIYLGKYEEYYKILQKNTIEKEFQAGEKLLASNKTNLMSGKDQNVLESVFGKIFSSLSYFPFDYPIDRLKRLIFAFFKKDQLKFLYTYAMPIFPVAYQAYMNAIEASSMPQTISKDLVECHGWNLKMWVMVRQKNILDRSINDTDIIKWIDIIFKSSCMLKGTFCQFLKLALKIINRYLSKIAASQFTSASFNRIIEHHGKVSSLISLKIEENIKEIQKTQVIIKRIQSTIKTEIRKTINEILNKNLQMIVYNSQQNLQNFKSFVTKILRKDKEFMLNNTINKFQNLFKNLDAFLKNNSDLSLEAIGQIKFYLQSELVKYFDKHYVPEIYNYAKENLVPEQLSQIMEVVGRERTILFQNYESCQ